MYYLRKYQNVAAHDADTEKHSAYIPAVCYAIDEDKVFFHEASTTVAELVQNGYATMYYYKSDSYDVVCGSTVTTVSSAISRDLGLGKYSYNNTRPIIQISKSCPYTVKQITDIAEVALGSKTMTITIDDDHVYSDITPHFVWSGQTSPTNYWTASSTGWTNISDTDIINLYNGKQLNYRMSPGLFYDVKFNGTEDLVIKFSSIYASYEVIEDGIFRPHRMGSGMDTTPNSITVIQDGQYTSVGFRLFSNLHTTKSIYFGGSSSSVWSYFDMQMTGLFENCYQLETLTLDCSFAWSGQASISNLCAFRNCAKLKTIPRGRYAATHTYATWTLTSNSTQVFANCNELETIEPTLNFSSVGTYARDETDGIFGGCNKLTTLSIKNLNNCDWDFVNNSKCALPSISAESINYMLNNVTDISSTTGYTITLPTLHQSEVSSDAISNATSKGWTVTFA